ncbi:MAG: hypothetical protein KJ737_22980 [Proteobacteria bacterium]|nr:hypothetical protein [Pseudomonadota bacterium]
MEESNIQEIKYSDCYVAFLDVLGFKNFVFDKKEGKKKIETYFGLIQETIHNIGNIESKQEIRSIIISDSVILSISLGEDKEKKIINLRKLCIAVAIIQFALAQKDIWLRGAISAGEAYFDANKHQVVGPAYTNAYLLEEKHAKYPRVIIDSIIIEKLGQIYSQDLIDAINEKKYSNWNSDILFSWSDTPRYNTHFEQDMALFIDYLSPMFDKDGINKSVLKHIKKNLYDRVEYYNKFRWIVDYLIVKCDKITSGESGFSQSDIDNLFKELKRF